MGYALGVDLGTTYTAAAVYRDGRVEIAGLGNRSADIPSVVLLREDETILTGEAANRRGLTEPGRVAREFKRRVGDTNPIFMGGAPHSAEAIMARLLAWVVAEVSDRQGGPPDRLAVTHPANWGQYKKDLLGQAVRLADLGGAVFLTEPEAAAIHYASQERVEAGGVIAVYDLGGGTFDAAVLRKGADGSFEILGEPEGVERLGGIDFDAAVYRHVAASLDGALDDLDETDPAAIAAGARLRQDCVEAKEALSTDTDVTIPVLFPTVQTEVRLTRAEFEAMIRPSLQDSIRAMRRALEAAQVTPEQVTAVLLVGGSSRVPLVSQMISADLGRPVAVDADPKHSVALGAALAAARDAGMAGTGATAPEPSDGAGATGAAAAGVAAGAAAGLAAGALAADAGPSPAHAAPVAASPPPPPTAPEPVVAASPPPAPPPPPAPATPPPPPPPPAAEPVVGAAAAAAAPHASPEAHTSPPTQPEPAVAAAETPVPPPPGEPAPPAPGGDDPGGADGGGGLKKGPLVAAGVAVALLILAGVALALSDGGGGGEAATDTTAAATDTGDDPDEDVPPPDDGGPTITDCTVAATNSCIVGASIEDGVYVIEYQAGFTESPDFETGRHQHLFFDPPTSPDEAGSNAPDFGLDPGDWRAYNGGSPFRDFTVADGLEVGATELCIRAANAPLHDFVPDTGNCVVLSTIPGFAEAAAAAGAEDVPAPETNTANVPTTTTTTSTTTTTTVVTDTTITPDTQL